jgi:hypothetical protein
VLANPGKYNRSETPSGPSSFDILYLNARKRNLEIAFLRYSRDFVTSVIVITEFYCSSSQFMTLEKLIECALPCSFD